MADFASEISSGLSALRDENARRVLVTLLEQPGGATQSDIVSATGLARSTVSILLSDTLRPVLSFEARDEGERGPPPRVWSVAVDAAFSVGLDIGKSHLAAALADPYGRLLGSPRVRLLDTLKDPDLVLNIAGEMVEEVVGTASKCRRIAAVTVGVPGTVDRERGFLVDPDAKGWHEFDIPEAVERRWPFPEAPRVEIENDANLGALGEFRYGAGRDCESLLFIKWSTGIGSGLILGAKLWHGKSGAAGEIGHLTVNPSKSDRTALGLASRSDAQRCPRCEQRECIEMVAGGAALARAVGVEDFRTVIEWAYDEDSRRRARARAALGAAAKLIGTAIGPVLTMLNVERVVVGGVGGRDAFPLVVDSMRRGVDQSAPPRARRDAEILPSELGDEAYVRGAAASGFARHGIDRLYSQASGPASEKARSERGAILAS